MKTKVVNLRKEPYDVYIGRAGRGQDGYFGNPCAIGQKCPVCSEVHKDGGSTIPCFKHYFYNRIRTDKDFLRRVRTLKGKTLGCFCKPNPCHGDVIAGFFTKLCKCGNFPCKPEEHAGWGPR